MLVSECCKANVADYSDIHDFAIHVVIVQQSGTEIGSVYSLIPTKILPNVMRCELTDGQCDIN